MSGDQKTVVRIVITLAAIAAAFFVGIPCCVSGYIFVSYQRQDQAKQRALKEMQMKQDMEQKLRETMEKFRDQPPP
jgi:cell division protein FtsB